MNKTSASQRFYPPSTTILAGIIAILVLGIYSGVGSFDYVNLDDQVYITENPYVTAGLNAETFRWAWTANRGGFWGPLTWLSFQLEVELFGLAPAVPHWTNVILHIINSLLLFALLRFATGAVWKSFFVAVLFAIHPLHVESVAWITERKDVLSTSLGFSSLLLYLHYTRSNSLWLYSLSLLLLIAGLCAKPLLVTLPALMLLMDVWPLNRLTGNKNCIRIIIVEKIPFLLASVVVAYVTLKAQSSAEALVSFSDINFNDRIANTFTNYTHYIVQMFYPLHLSPFYPYEGVKPLLVINLSIIVVLAIFIISVYLKATQGFLFLGWWWYMIALLPMSGIVPFGHHASADRFTYIPLVGLFIIVIWGWERWLPTIWQRKLSPLIGVVLLTLCILCWQQINIWKNNITLFSHALKIDADNYVAHNSLGEAYLKSNRTNEAIKHLQQAIKIKPEFAEAHNNLGLALVQAGQYSQAMDQYQETIRLRPESPKPWNNIGTLLVAGGKHTAAIDFFQEALKRSPSNRVSLINLAAIESHNKNYSQAIDYLKQAKKYYPKDPIINRNLTEIYALLIRSE